jgi:2-polyprenyl-3-methyl-5-hydroxy-6-metoxy-1,4-benzoquinol methylase
MEHLRDPREVLVNANKILKDNGKLVLEVPNQFFVLKNEVYFRLGRIRFEKPYNPYHHLYFFSPYTLKAMLRTAGFRIVEFNEVYGGANRTFKNRINYALSWVFKMGVSSRIEVVASRMDSSSVSSRYDL